MHKLTIANEVNASQVQATNDNLPAHGSKLPAGVSHTPLKNTLSPPGGASLNSTSNTCLKVRKATSKLKGKAKAKLKEWKFPSTRFTTKLRSATDGDTEPVQTEFGVGSLMEQATSDLT